MSRKTDIRCGSDLTKKKKDLCCYQIWATFACSVNIQQESLNDALGKQIQSLSFCTALLLSTIKNIHSQTFTAACGETGTHLQRPASLPHCYPAAVRPLTSPLVGHSRKTSCQEHEPAARVLTWHREASPLRRAGNEVDVHERKQTVC